MDEKPKATQEESDELTPEEQAQADELGAQLLAEYKRHLEADREKDAQMEREQELFDQAFPQIMQRFQEKTRRQTPPKRTGKDRS